MTPAFQTLGFSPAYDVEIDPEFPGDGDWRCAVFGYDRDGTVMEDFHSRWGPPMIMAVSPPDTQRWVGKFASGGLGVGVAGATGAFGCPASTDLCVLADGLAYVLSVEDPAGGAFAARLGVRQIVRVEGHPLLLLVTFTDIVAIGTAGVAWQTPRIALDDLWVESADAHSIVCSVKTFDLPPTIVLDPASGEQTEGASFSSVWPESVEGEDELPQKNDGAIVNRLLSLVTAVALWARRFAGANAPRSRDEGRSHDSE